MFNIFLKLDKLRRFFVKKEYTFFNEYDIIIQKAIRLCLSLNEKRRIEMRKTKKFLAVALSVVMAASAAALSVVSSQAVPGEAYTPNSNFTWDNASVYFLLTDRFNNGKTENDHSYNRGLNQDGTVATSMTTDAASFHGGDFVGITQKINEGYFNDLGINALWISAPYEQAHGYSIGDTANKSYPHYAYHGYYVLDYTQTDANFGTAEEFQQMVDAAHSKGIRVVLDVVMNHPGYATMYDMNQYNFGVLKTGWENTYYNFGNINNAKFDAVISYNTGADKWANWWGPDWIRAGIAGYTAGGSDDLTMGVSYLPDFKTEQTKEVDIPTILKTKWQQEGVLEQRIADANAWFAETGYAKTVRNYEVYWLSTWVREYGVDGFRCDTAKHVEMDSWVTLKTECVKALREWKAENPDKALDNLDFWMVGENFNLNQTLNKNEYFTSGAFDSMINFAYGSAGGSGVPSIDTIGDVYQQYADTINTDDDFNMLTYISSHDDGLSRKDLIYQGTAFQLMPGGIQIFYGDETNRPKLGSITVDGKKQGLADHSYRSDMNWDSIDTNVLSHWQKVGTFRNNHVAVGAGSNQSVDTTDGIAFVRTYDKNGVTDKVAACIAENANVDVTITVGSAFADGTEVQNVYNNTSAVVENGKVTFNSGDNKTILIEEVLSAPPYNPSDPSEEPTEEPTSGTQDPTDEPTDSSETPSDATRPTNGVTSPSNATDASNGGSGNGNGSNGNNSNNNGSTTNDGKTATGKVATGDSTTISLLLSLLILSGSTLAAVTIRKKRAK